MQCPLSAWLQRLLRGAVDRAMLVALGATVIGAAACSTPGPGAVNTASTKSALIFAQSVQPLLESRCTWCHSDALARGGIDFQNRDAVLNDARPLIVPGAAEQSLVYQAVARPEAHPRVMPGDGWGVTGTQQRALKTWIDSGADWPVTIEIQRKPYQVDMDDYL